MRIALLTLLLLCGSPAIAQHRPLTVVKELDVQKYAGSWYEIARFPNRFQDHCASDVMAEYTPRPDGRITVVNRCRTSSGKWDEAEGVARRVEGAPSSALKVRFAPAVLSFLSSVWGDYQVMALDDAYTHALVGTPDRKYLWILSRTPTLDDAIVKSLMEVAAGQGFDVGKLERTSQTNRGTS